MRESGGNGGCDHRITRGRVAETEAAITASHAYHMHMFREGAVCGVQCRTSAARVRAARGSPAAVGSVGMKLKGGHPYAYVCIAKNESGSE